MSLLNILQAVHALDAARENPVCPPEIKESLDKCMVSIVCCPFNLLAIHILSVILGNSLQC